MLRSYSHHSHRYRHCAHSYSSPYGPCRLLDLRLMQKPYAKEFLLEQHVVAGVANDLFGTFADSPLDPAAVRLFTAFA